VWRSHVRLVPETIGWTVGSSVARGLLKDRNRMGNDKRTPQDALLPVTRLVTTLSMTIRNGQLAVQPVIRQRS
jgi:hypothetical protein